MQGFGLGGKLVSYSACNRKLLRSLRQVANNWYTFLKDDYSYSWRRDWMEKSMRSSDKYSVTVQVRDAGGFSWNGSGEGKWLGL